MSTGILSNFYFSQLSRLMPSTHHTMRVWLCVCLSLWPAAVASPLRFRAHTRYKCSDISFVQRMETPWERCVNYSSNLVNLDFAAANDTAACQFFGLVFALLWFGCAQMCRCGGRNEPLQHFASVLSESQVFLFTRHTSASKRWRKVRKFNLHFFFGQFVQIFRCALRTYLNWTADERNSISLYECVAQLALRHSTISFRLTAKAGDWCEFRTSNGTHRRWSSFGI